MHSSELHLSLDELTVVKGVLAHCGPKVHLLGAARHAGTDDASLSKIAARVCSAMNLLTQPVKELGQALRSSNDDEPEALEDEQPEAKADADEAKNDEQPVATLNTVQWCEESQTDWMALLHGMDWALLLDHRQRGTLTTACTCTGNCSTKSR